MVGIYKNTFDSFKGFIYAIFNIADFNNEKNSAYDYLRDNYIFRVDNIKDQEISLQVIGSRSVHTVELTDIVNNAFFYENLDPRELLSFGYQSYHYHKLSLKQFHENKTSQRKVSLSKKLSIELSENHKNIEKKYAYHIINVDFLHQTISLQVKGLEKCFSLKVIELTKDVYLAAEVQPSQLLKLGYDFAEKNINIWSKI